MQYELYIRAHDLETLHQYAEKQLPQEAAALLFGRIIDSQVNIKHVELVKNDAKASMTAFAVNPEHEYQLLMEAEERGESLVCIYHSHPAPPRPSETDVKNMRLNPVVWLISSKLTGDWVTKAYILKDDEVTEIPIRYQNPTDGHL
jgi:proteasome lid subunit RPN8/RPN11